MDLKKLLKFLRLLEQIPLEYMVTGSIASILYGKPRLTHDMDVVVLFPLKQASLFCQNFNTDEFYCPPLEVIQEEIKRGDNGHLNIIDQSSGFKIDLYPFRYDPLIQWGFKSKKEIEILPSESVWVAPPEYVILKKMLYYAEGGSEKHLEDIRSMLEVSGAEIDKKILEEWVHKLNLKLVYEKI